MPGKDLYHNVDVLQALAPAARGANAAVNGADIDLSGYENALFELNVGTWTDGTHTPKLQEADDNGSGAPGTYADVAAANTVGTFTPITSAPTASKAYKYGYFKYNTNKRWVRLVVTTSGATTGAVFGATVARGGARNLPLPYSDTVG
jgi:hypothetical protein